MWAIDDGRSVDIRLSACLDSVATKNACSMSGSQASPVLGYSVSATG